MNSFASNFDKILGISKIIKKKESFLTQIIEPKLKGIELINKQL